MVLGSRAHQVAMYTVFESPLQMMCDSPTIYKKEQEVGEVLGVFVQYELLTV